MRKFVKGYGFYPKYFGYPEYIRTSSDINELGNILLGLAFKMFNYMRGSNIHGFKTS